MNMKRILVALAILITWKIMPALAAEPELLPAYACTGANANDRPYKVNLYTHKDGSSYQLLWLTDSEERFLGVGYVEDGRVIASYSDFDSGLGATSYLIAADGSLDGHYTFLGVPGVFVESCKPMEDANPTFPEHDRARPSSTPKTEKAV